jgi:UDP-N-acetylmuramate dehydrogenase
MTSPIKQDFSLQSFNTFGIEAKARFFAEVGTIEELKAILLSPAYQAIPKLILGGGSNLLFTQDFEGLVIKMGIKGIEKMREDNENIWIKVGAGENWHDFVMYCLEQGWYGVENLSLIYGTVGAAPMQNIGAYGVELREIFDLLIAIDRETGNQQFFTYADCKFGYRESVFKHDLKDKYVITEVIFQLCKKQHLNTSYGAIQQTLAEMGINQPTPKTISEAVIKIRRSKLPNPEQVGNAGSFFKNPEILKSHFENLRAQYPNMPSYPAGEQKVKVPAGWLIEQCGWKGRRVGNTGVHKDQALVIVNYGGATGLEIKELANKIQVSVIEKFDIHLDTEVNII